jgi:hypothetical protein
MSVAVHGHDVGEHGAGAVVLVGIEEDTEAVELVHGAKDIAGSSTFLGEPHGKAVAEEVPLTMNLELDCDLAKGELKSRMRIWDGKDSVGDVPPNL